LPIERVDEVVEHHSNTFRHCSTLLWGENPDLVRHPVIKIPPINPVVIEHRLHRLVWLECSTRTCATLPADGSASHYGPHVSAVVDLLDTDFP
jgi:hypothetical protein